MSRVFQIAAVYAAFLAGVFFYYIISSGSAGWLSVESPSAYFRGHAFPIKITLLKPAQGLYLSADLHWINDDSESYGYLAGSEPVKVEEGKTVYQLSVPAVTGNDAASVYGVITLSRDGTWAGRNKAARFRAIPVIANDEAGISSVMKKRKTYVLNSLNPARHRESVPLRLAVAGIWILIAMTWRRFEGRWIVAISLISSAWEALNGSIILHKLLRKAAIYIGSYNDRHGFQQFMTMVVVIIFFFIVMRYVMRARYSKNTVLWICIAAFWTVSVISVFSLHEVDEILTRTVYGIELGQLMRIVISLLCLVAVLAMRFNDKTGAAEGRKNTI